MKKIYNYIMLLTLAFVAVCCSEEVIDAPSTSAQSGDDVQFTLSLNKESRTIYGPEANNAFPIYWVEGDKVQIFSPQALAGRRNAEYQVSVGGATEQNYANSLTKTGDYGVQWGDKQDSYTFYSLYPSGDYTLSTDGTKAENIQINYSQNINVTTVDGKEVIKSDMEDCLMYAKTVVPGVDEEGNDNRGTTVKLQYNPISTVVMLTVKVAENQQGTDADNFTIQSVTLEADVAIAGTFSLNISDGTFGEFEKNKSSKTIKADIVNTSTGGYHTISNGESFEIPIFLAPISDLSVKNWKISIVANNNTYTKTLNIEKVLTPGQIHKITLPELKPAETEWEVSKWMTYIPRNVYLSEVSIPGSWNSINGDFQTNTSIAEQYAAGVRAFHIDTRWQGRGLGALAYCNGVLGIAYKSSSLGGATDKYMPAESEYTFEKQFGNITGAVKEDEYMVVVCSFAQNSAEYDGVNGWIKAINNICNNNDKVYDARKIGPKTMVGDVLGKVIVIVNVAENIGETTTPGSSLAENSKCFFTYLPSELTKDHFNGNDDNKDNLWTTTTTVSSSGITIYNNQVQITSVSDDKNIKYGDGIETSKRGYAPTLSERTEILEKIVNWSKDNYGSTDYQHDQWMYLGLGGYQTNNADASSYDGSYSAIASTYNNWINDKVTEMGTTVNGEVVPYYPVGIVLMNYVNNYASTVKNILLLNNKYRLQYDPSKPSDYNPNALSVTNYSATATNGGNAFDTK